MRRYIRFAQTDEMAKNLKRYKQAMVFLLTTRGIPQHGRKVQV